eukprot:3536957-Amphidinium_carterae.1
MCVCVLTLQLCCWLGSTLSSGWKHSLKSACRGTSALVMPRTPECFRQMSQDDILLTTYANIWPKQHSQSSLGQCGFCVLPDRLRLCYCLCCLLLLCRGWHKDSELAGGCMTMALLIETCLWRTCC